MSRSNDEPYVLHVSNRLVPPGTKAAGGLDELLKGQAELRLGWSGKTYEGESSSLEVIRGHRQISAMMPLEKSVSERFYACVSPGKPASEKTDISNGVSWFVHHGLEPDPVTPEMRVAFHSAGKKFAKSIVDLLNPATSPLSAAERAVDGIIVHDYQIENTGRHLRELGFKQPVAFYLHIPFPGAEDRAKISKADQKMFWGGYLDYDLVGFQSKSDRNNFLDYARSDLGASLRGNVLTAPDGRLIKTGVYPAGTNPENFRSFGLDYTDARLDELKQVVGTRQSVVYVGRQDLSKGIEESLQGLKGLFSSRPDVAEQTAVVMIAPQTRQGVQKYVDYRDRIIQLSQEINEAFGGPKLSPAEKAAEKDTGRIGFGGGPIILAEEPMDQQQLASLNRNARVVMAPSLKDGQCLVPLEAVAASHHADPPAIVVGKGCGVAETLGPGGALVVDARKPEDIARGILGGLTMPLSERQARYNGMMGVVETQTAANWHNSLLHDLVTCHEIVQLAPPNPVTLRESAGIRRDGTSRFNYPS